MKRRADVYQHKNMYGNFFYSLSPKDGDPEQPSNLVGNVIVPNDCEVFECESGQVVCVKHGPECDQPMHPVRWDNGFRLVPQR